MILRNKNIKQGIYPNGQNYCSINETEMAKSIQGNSEQLASVLKPRNLLDQTNTRGPTFSYSLSRNIS